MLVVQSKEELLAYVEEPYTKHLFYLAKKGYKKTISGEFVEAQADEAREKYNLSESISDFDFGSIEGDVFFSMLLESFYDKDLDEGLTAWIQGLISSYMDKIKCFIFKCVVNKPQISTSLAYNFTEQLQSKLQDIAACDKHLLAEINNWYYTPYEFGNLCGFVSAAHRAIGDEWVFNEDALDMPVDWNRFYDYLDKRALKLKKRKIREMSVVFQIITDVPVRRRGNSNNSSPVMGLRCKKPNEPVKNSLILPKPTSWLDW